MYELVSSSHSTGEGKVKEPEASEAGESTSAVKLLRESLHPISFEEHCAVGMELEEKPKLYHASKRKRKRKNYHR